MTEDRGRFLAWDRGRGRGRGQGRNRGRSEKRGKSSDDREIRKCHHCDIPGHLIKDYRKLKRKQSQSSAQPKKEDSETAITIMQDVTVFSIDEENCLYVANYEAEWMVDTAASSHATPHKSFFRSYTAGDFGTVKIENTNCSSIMKIDDVQVKTTIGCTMILKDVRHISDLRLNLLSGTALDKQGYASLWPPKLFIQYLKHKCQILEISTSSHKYKPNLSVTRVTI